MKKSTEQNLTPWGGGGVTGFMAVLLAIVQHSEERWAAEPSLQASPRLSVVFTLHASILNCTTFFASSITIITNHRGWKTLPVCVCWFAEGTFLSRPGRKWEAPRRREGPHNRFPERFEEGTTGEPRPLLSPGPWWCLRGHMDACLCAPSHQPILHPPPPPYTPPSPWQDRPREWVMAGVTWSSLLLMGIGSISSFSSPSHPTFKTFVLPFIRSPSPLSSLLRNLRHSVKTWR